MALLILLLIAFGVAGFYFGNVPVGHQGIRFRLGKRVEENRVFTEGWAQNWIVPFIDKLTLFRLGHQSTRLRECEFQTGCLGRATVSIVCEWQIDQARIIDFSAGHDVDASLEATIKEIVSIFFRHLNDQRDLYSPKLIPNLSDLLFDAVRERIMGNRVSARGATWDSLELKVQPGVFSRLGVQITGLNVLEVDFPDIVIDAQGRNVAGIIDAGTLRETGSATAEAVEKIVRAGGSAELAQLQTERQISPHIRKTDPPDQQNILIQNPNGLGLPARQSEERRLLPEKTIDPETPASPDGD